MGYKADKEKRNIRDHNKEHLGLTEFEIILHEAIMTSDHESMPENLRESIEKTYRMYQDTMDFDLKIAIAVDIADWLKVNLR